MEDGAIRLKRTDKSKANTNRQIISDQEAKPGFRTRPDPVFAYDKGDAERTQGGEPEGNRAKSNARH